MQYLQKRTLTALVTLGIFRLSKICEQTVKWLVVQRLQSELQLKSKDWLLQRTSAPHLIGRPSTLAHFRCADSWTNLANVLFHCREVTQSGIFTGHRRNVKLPVPPGRGLCHASFQHNEFLQAVSLKGAPLYRTAQLHGFSSRNISK